MRDRMDFAGAKFKGDSQGERVSGQVGESPQIREDQFPQLIAVAALQDTKRGNPQSLDFRAQPVVILRFQRFVRQRIVRVSVESRRNGDEVGLEILYALERARQHPAVIGARRAGRDGEVKSVAAHVRRAGARIARCLVDGKKRGAGLVSQNVLRAVAVVDIEIENGDPPRAGRQRSPVPLSRIELR